MHIPSSFLRAGALALTLAFLSAPAANAVVITVDSQQYDVTTVVGTAPDLAATLESQVWWQDSSMAAIFADALGSGLGYPNSALSPFFAWAMDMQLFAMVTDSGGAKFPYIGSLTNPHTFAIATLVPSAGVPDTGATIAMLGLALAGLSALRRRLA